MCIEYARKAKETECVAVGSWVKVCLPSGIDVVERARLASLERCTDSMYCQSCMVDSKMGDACCNRVVRKSEGVVAKVKHPERNNEK